MFSRNLIQQIIEVWVNDQNHPHRERRELPLPDYDFVKQIIEISFLASLKREEERPLNFGVVLSSPEEAFDSLSDLNPPDRILQFENPKIFSVDSICKLASAFDPTLSLLAVSTLEEESNSLYIWGVYTFEKLTHRFNELPVGLHGEISHHPDAFTVHVSQPGALIISRSHSQIGKLINGEFYPSKPTPFTQRSLGQYLIEQVETHSLSEEYGNFYWHIYSDALEQLLSIASQKGHGSTIVLLPPDNVGVYTEHVKQKYSFRQKLGLERLFRLQLSYANGDTSISSRQKVNRLILEKLEVIAQLATLDGALILTNKLDVIAYGSTLTASEWTGSVKTGPDGFGENSGQHFERERLGTRHNSAINFAGKCPGSLLFVISQDGPIRAFLRTNDDLVMCWPNCNVSMFL